jgi:hypothetical protein
VVSGGFRIPVLKLPQKKEKKSLKGLYITGKS